MFIKRPLAKPSPLRLSLWERVGVRGTKILSCTVLILILFATVSAAAASPESSEQPEPTSLRNAAACAQDRLLNPRRLRD